LSHVGICVDPRNLNTPAFFRIQSAVKDLLLYNSPSKLSNDLCDYLYKQSELEEQNFPKDSLSMSNCLPEYKVQRKITLPKGVSIIKNSPSITLTPISLKQSSKKLTAAQKRKLAAEEAKNAAKMAKISKTKANVNKNLNVYRNRSYTRPVGKGSRGPYKKTQQMSIPEKIPLFPKGSIPARQALPPRNARIKSEITMQMLLAEGADANQAEIEYNNANIDEGDPLGMMEVNPLADVSDPLEEVNPLGDVETNPLEDSSNPLEVEHATNPLEESENPLEDSTNPLEDSANPLEDSSNPLEDSNNLQEDSNNLQEDSVQDDTEDVVDSVEVAQNSENLKKNSAENTLENKCTTNKEQLESERSTNQTIEKDSIESGQIDSETNDFSEKDSTKKKTNEYVNKDIHNLGENKPNEDFPQNEKNDDAGDKEKENGRNENFPEFEENDDITINEEEGIDPESEISDAAENEGDHAENEGGDTEKEEDDAENEENVEENEGYDAENEGDDAKNKGDDVKNKRDDAENEGKNYVAENEVDINQLSTHVKESDDIETNDDIRKRTNDDALEEKTNNFPNKEKNEDETNEDDTNNEINYDLDEGINDDFTKKVSSANEEFTTVQNSNILEELSEQNETQNNYENDASYSISIDQEVNAITNQEVDESMDAPT